MTRYHYVLTIQYSGAPGLIQISYTTGVIVPQRGQPRNQVFRELWESAIAQSQKPWLRDPVPLFFSLEPDDLTAEGGLTP